MTSAMASEMTWISFFRSTHAALQLMVLESLVVCTRVSQPCRKLTFCERSICWLACRVISNWLREGSTAKTQGAVMEPRYLLDTNICIYIRQNRPDEVLRGF